MSKPKKCPDCNMFQEIENMLMKMGGLLCPQCRIILYQPYVDEEYFEEHRRRQKEDQAENKAENQ